MKLLLVLLPAVAFAASIDNAVVNGGDADIANFPYQGSFRTSGASHTCGCVLVASGWALSAAHCGGNSAYTTEWGSSDRGSGLVVGVSSVTLHPFYGSGSGAFPNDVSVLQLSGSAEGANISPATIPQGRMGSGDGVISGWGRLCGGCGIPVTLQYLDMPILTDAGCLQYWGSNYNPDVHICVYDGQGGACNGDSGGPLFSNNAVQGITSWVASGCLSSMPSTYARTSTYYEWFCSTTGGAAQGC